VIEQVENQQKDQSIEVVEGIMGRLEHKVAVITGGGAGIGQGIAICFAEEGADIVINDIVFPQETVDAVLKIGRRALAVVGDVGDRDQVSSLFNQAIATFGKVDIVVANAYYSYRAPFIEAEWEYIQKVFQVSQFGVWHACQFGSQQMVKQGTGGKIIIIGSVLGEVAMKTSAAYNMTKAALTQFCRTVAAELAPNKINVNVIAPGWIDTPGERRFSSEKDISNGASQIPWGRLGTPNDIAKAAVYLASDDADYVTGITLKVDGGYTCGVQLPPPPNV